MFTSPNSGESVKARVSSCSSLVESIQDITLRAMLNRAVDLVADCSDKCNRQAEEGHKHDLAKRERSLQGIALSSMGFTPLAGTRSR